MRAISLLALVTLASIPSSCIPSNDSRAAHDLAAEVRAAFDAGDATTFYSLTSQAYRQATSKADTTHMINVVNARLGPCGQAGEPLNSSWYRGTGGYTITLVFERTCANGPLTETYTISMDTRPPRLHGFNYNSPALFPDAPADPAAPQEAPEATPAPSTTPA